MTFVDRPFLSLPNEGEACERETHLRRVPEWTRMHKTMGSGIANQSVCHQNSTPLEFHPNDIIITLLASGYFLAMSPMRRLKFINGVAQSIIIYV